MFSHDADQRKAMDLELGWSARLEEALRNDQFVLCFPADPADGADRLRIPARTAGRAVDAPPAPLHQPAGLLRCLIRLRDGDGGLAAPAALPAAERFSLIGEIDRWVIKKNAPARPARVPGQRPPAGITINISAQSFGQTDLALTSPTAWWNTTSDPARSCSRSPRPAR